MTDSAWSIEYDADADALYITVAEGDVADTVVIDDSHNVDLDAAGQPLGAELLYPGRGMRLKEISDLLQVDIAELAERIDRALMEADAYAQETETSYAGDVHISYAVVALTTEFPEFDTDQVVLGFSTGYLVAPVEQRERRPAAAGTLS